MFWYIVLLLVLITLIMIGHYWTDLNEDMLLPDTLAEHHGALDTILFVVLAVYSVMVAMWILK